MFKRMNIYVVSIVTPKELQSVAIHGYDITYQFACQL